MNELLAKMIEREVVLEDRAERAERHLALLLAEVKASRLLLKDKWFLSKDQGEVEAWMKAGKKVDESGVLA